MKVSKIVSLSGMFGVLALAIAIVGFEVAIIEPAKVVAQENLEVDWPKP